MERLKPTDIISEVREVLENAFCGKGKQPCYLTAYQILDRLPRYIGERLILERGLGGRGNGTHYSAASVVSNAAEMIGNVETVFLDTEGIRLRIGEQDVAPGSRSCGLYRIISPPSG